LVVACSSASFARSPFTPKIEKGVAIQRTIKTPIARTKKIIAAIKNVTEGSRPIIYSPAASIGLPGPFKPPG
jgi:hypothetical protein